MQGRGFVPVAVVPHYRTNRYGEIDWKPVERDLRTVSDLPIVYLGDGEVEVFEDGTS
jgi:hypothetical protein